MERANESTSLFNPYIFKTVAYSPETGRNPRMKSSRPVLIRDFLIFWLKLWLDSFKDVILIQISIVAVIIDLLLGNRRTRLFYSVMKLGERFDLWLNLHGALAHGETSGDGLFGGSKAGSKTLLGKIEQIVRGGDEPRGSG
jgi:hypothetical protein